MQHLNWTVRIWAWPFCPFIAELIIKAGARFIANIDMPFFPALTFCATLVFLFNAACEKLEFEKTRATNVDLHSELCADVSALRAASFFVILAFGVFCLLDVLQAASVSVEVIGHFYFLAILASFVGIWILYFGYKKMLVTYKIRSF
jgi:hypothetical protein